MGELVTQGLKHAHDIVVDMLNQVGATDVYAMTDLEEVVSATRLDPLTRKHETWYIAKSGSPRHKGVPYIGVILLSPSIEESDELKQTGGSIFSSTAGREFPVTDPCVQVWGRKVMAAASGLTTTTARWSSSTRLSRRPTSSAGGATRCAGERKPVELTRRFSPVGYNGGRRRIAPPE